MSEKWSPFGGTPEHAQAVVNSSRGLTCVRCGKRIEVGVRIYKDRGERYAYGLPAVIHRRGFRHAECPPGD